MEGATMAQLVAELDSATRARVVARGTGMHAPIYARVRGEEWSELLDNLAHSVGMSAMDADGATLVADAATAVAVQRRAARQAASPAPLESAYLQVQYPGSTAVLLAEFVLSCRGTIVVLPGKQRLLVEDTAEHIEQIREWTDVLEDEDAEWDRSYSRDRKQRFGVSDARVPVCSDGLRGASPGADEIAAGRVVLERALEQDSDVVVGCGSESPLASNPAALPQTAMVDDYMGFAELAEGIWVGEAFAEKSRAMGAAADRTTQWRVVRHTPLGQELRGLLNYKFAAHYRAMGHPASDDILLAMRQGHLEDIRGLIETYDGLGEE